jgi:hypothetical protein
MGNLILFESNKNQNLPDNEKKILLQAIDGSCIADDGPIDLEPSFSGNLQPFSSHQRNGKGFWKGFQCQGQYPFGECYR